MAPEKVDAAFARLPHARCWAGRPAGIGGRWRSTRGQGAGGSRYAQRAETTGSWPSAPDARRAPPPTPAFPPLPDAGPAPLDPVSRRRRGEDGVRRAPEGDGWDRRGFSPRAVRQPTSFPTGMTCDGEVEIRALRAAMVIVGLTMRGRRRGSVTDYQTEAWSGGLVLPPSRRRRPSQDEPHQPEGRPNARTPCSPCGILTRRLPGTPPLQS